MSHSLRTHWLLAAAALILGAGCAGLPAPQPPLTKMVAVYFQPGKSTLGVYNSASWYLEHSLSSTPVYLRAGLNFIPVPGDRTSVQLLRFYATTDIQSKRYTVAAKTLSWDLRLPEDGALVLAGVNLSYHEEKSGSSYRLQADVTSLDPAKASKIVEDWKKEKTGALWSVIRVEPY